MLQCCLRYYILGFGDRLGRLDGIQGIIRGNLKPVISVTTIIHLVERNLMTHKAGDWETGMRSNSCLWGAPGWHITNDVIQNQRDEHDWYYKNKSGSS